MFVACGESLLDVYEEARRPGGALLDARIGGPLFNVVSELRSHPWGSLPLQFAR